MKKTLALAMTALTAFAASLTGCAVDTEREVRDTTHAYTSGMSCETNNGINPLKAALAVAMSTEIGRVDPIRDLSDSWGTVLLTDEAKQACASRGYGDCPNTQAILGMQSGRVNETISNRVFDATVFREELRASFERQRNHEDNLRRNEPWKLPGEHELYLTGQSDYGACGIHYDFAAYGHNVQNLQERMVFFGANSNPFIDFRSSEGSISIDPTGTMNGDTSTSSGMCTVGCYGYGTQLLYQCCSCNGHQGKFLRAPWNRNMVYCAY